MERRKKRNKKGRKDLICRPFVLNIQPIQKLMYIHTFIPKYVYFNSVAIFLNRWFYVMFMY